MSDITAAIEMLLRRHMALEGKLEALTQVFATVLARAANESNDATGYIITALAPMTAMAESFDQDDPQMAYVAERILDFADQLESSALSRLT
ncbi:hypothetical protein [Seohaeicola zhoushanensis]|uniref:Uncharacterized protein n=1 Tax=Seohaeicola zhoushanensis TaxID=1569283 RepID=A0A8J3H165_9RHOB|nr:hypothetical protein [Seohaeicola zhoushanensis]GHF71012.1 hypothetical protein GCM10017056_47410 [Seohaeicola zhoushanensis]